MIKNATSDKRQATSYNFVFFGTDEFSVIVLDGLMRARFTPSLIVTAPDARKGRGMKLTPSPVKSYIMKRGTWNIKIFQPSAFDESFRFHVSSFKPDLFVVASYGKIIPKEVLDIPKYGVLNVHPSLLPLFRGPSPIHSQILENSRIVGVTIMLMDEKIDHGPILAERELEFSIFNFQFSKLRDELARLGGKLLAEVIPKWINGEITPRAQDHALATYTKQIKKEDGRIDPHGDQELNYRKFLAYTPWPSVYFMKNGKRIKITDAELKNGAFIIKKVIPEGGREISYAEFKKNSPISQ